jgi:hypothetical protein
MCSEHQSHQSLCGIGVVAAHQSFLHDDLACAVARLPR